MKKSLNFSLVLATTVTLGWLFLQAIEKHPGFADNEPGHGGVTVAGNGDVNGDNGIDLSDAIYLLAYLFQGGDAPEPCPAGGGDCTACEAELATCQAALTSSQAALTSSQAALTTCQAELLACTGGVSEICDNDIDDDMDCNIDCADSDCEAAANCLCDEASGADFVDCFATYANQEAADAAWETSSAQIGVDLSKAALGFELNPSPLDNQSISYDLQQADALGPGNFPSSTAWVLRLHFRYSFLEFGESNQIFFGISDMDKDTDHSSPQDWIGARIFAKTGGLIRSYDTDDMAPRGGASQQSALELLVDTDYYFELVRIEQQYTVKIFTNSDFTSGNIIDLGGELQTQPNLRYIKFGNLYEAGVIIDGSSQEGIIDNVEFWDGVASPP
jgi:hypothetical protein